MTLKDIANEVGVSISTVSRVINNTTPSAASKEVEDKIWKIVNESGYHPNEHAKFLKTTKNTKSENAFIACLFARSTDLSQDGFFINLARIIETEAFSHGYSVKYSFIAKEIDDTLIQKLQSDNVKGIIVLGKFGPPILKFLKQNFKHVVYVSLNYINTSTLPYDQILCDGYSIAKEAVKHLYKLGHRKIAYIGDCGDEQRYSGYCDALKDLSIPVKLSYVHNIVPSSKGGYDAAKMLLHSQHNITAIFSINDITSVGVIKAIKDCGLRVPNDISVISVDNIELAQYVSPMLTTFHIPIDEMGRVAVKQLIDRMNKGHALPLRIYLPFRLVERESCEKIKLS